MILRVLLALQLSILFISSVSAQNPQLLGGVVVRPTSEVGFAEKLEIAMKRALVPRSRVVAALHAYHPGIVCGDDRPGLLEGHDGVAAIVVGSDSTTVALYYPTVSEAVTDARQHWCKDRNETWKFSTAMPLSGGIQAEGHFLTRDIEGIEARISGLHAARQGKSGAPARLQDASPASDTDPADQAVASEPLPSSRSTEGRLQGKPYAE